jgi:hypothetical protein
LTDVNIRNFLKAGNDKKCEKVILKVLKRWQLGLAPIMAAGGEGVTAGSQVSLTHHEAF